LALVLAACKDNEQKVTRPNLISIVVTPETVRIDEKGFTQQLTATTTPSGADEILEWSSENPLIATVTGDGLVTANRGGKTNIKVSGGGVETIVPVLIAVFENFILTPTSAMLELNQTLQISVEFIPSEITGFALDYESDNTSVATVSNTGLVTAIGGGNATITASRATVSQTVEITVNDPNEPNQNLWKKMSVSSEWNDNYLVENAFDGKINTFWHSATSAAMPQWFSVDMGGTKNIDGFLFTNRQDASQVGGRPKHIVVETSADNVNWEIALDMLDLPNLLERQVLTLSQRKTARYFKLTVYNTWGGTNYTYIAEINIYAGTPPALHP
jgi:hypothetical protein